MLRQFVNYSEKVVSLVGSSTLMYSLCLFPRNSPGTAINCFVTLVHVGCLEASYLASVPQSKRYKLDKKLDFNHGGVPIDLSTIASSMDEWEGNIAEQLQLTRPEIEDIKMEYPGKLSLQTLVIILTLNSPACFFLRCHHFYMAELTPPPPDNIPPGQIMYLPL